jgi:hypothetical protein
MTDATESDLPRMSDDQLLEVMRLLKGSDTAELKVSIPAEAQRATIRGLPLDPVEAQTRQVYFFDTPDLALYNGGLVVRARRSQGGRGDTVIKLRPAVPDELPEDLRSSGALNVEVDAVPGGFICSASFKGRSDGESIRAAVSGELPLRKLFSRDQRTFFTDFAPAGLELDSLVPLGPTFVLKGQFTPPELNRRMVAEMWLYPDGSRILELSTKCLPNEMFQVAAEARAYLAHNGVPIGAAQQMKTKTALAFFTAELQAAAAEAKTGGRKRATKAATAKAR